MSKGLLLTAIFVSGAFQRKTHQPANDAAVAKHAQGPAGSLGKQYGVDLDQMLGAAGGNGATQSSPCLARSLSRKS